MTDLLVKAKLARGVNTRAAPLHLAALVAVLLVSPAVLAGSADTTPPAGQPGGAAPRLTPPTPALPAEDAGPAFNIPPVFERPLGVDEGERIFVKGFVLKGIEDDARTGIRTAEIEARVQERFEQLQKLVEELRVANQNQTNVDADGYTPEEKEKVLAFIRDVLATVDPEQQVSAYQAFIQGLKLQRLERDAGLTIGQIGLIADEVTKYYRQRGYFLARAVIPAQEVVGGIVTIRVLEGRLGNVIAEGNKRYESADLQAPFQDIKGKLITVERIEDALLTVQAYPGIGATGVFRPGKTVGTADLVVNVQREKIHDLSIRADNHGSNVTGTDRLVLDYTWNGPLHDADLLNVQAVNTYSPENSLYGGVRYEAKFDDPDWRWGAALNNTTFDVTSNGAIIVSGTTDEARLYFTKQLVRSRTKKSKFTLEFLRKTGDTLSGGNTLSSDEEAVVAMQVESENISAATSTISSYYLRVDQGYDGYWGVPTCEAVANGSQNYSRTESCGDFTKFSFGYSALKSLAPTRSLLFRLATQWSDDRLTSLEQFNLGGVNTVRAGATSSALRDYGIYGSLEYQTRGLWFGTKAAWGGRNWNQVLGTSMFYDYAVGLTNRTDAEANALIEALSVRRIAMGGPGVSFDLLLPGDLTMKVQYANMNAGQQGSPGQPGAITDGDQLWVEFSRSF